MAITRLTWHNLVAHRSRYLLGTVAVVVATAFLVGGSLLITALESQLRLAGADDQGTSGGLFALLSAFGLVVVVAAGFVIANSFQTMVVSRGRELALLRTVGMRRRQAFQAVLVEAALIGLAGAAAGLLAGTLLAGAITAWALPDVGLVLPGPGTIALATLVALGVTLVAGLLPARKATEVSPVSALSAAPTQSGDALPPSRIAVGAVLLAAGLGLVLLPLAGALAALAFITGALIGFAGLAVLAPAAMPALAAALTAVVRSTPMRLAAGNVDRSRRRIANTTMAMVLGTTLFTGAIVVLNSTIVAARQAGYGPDSVTGIYSLAIGLTGYTVVVGVIGVINTLSLSIRERTQEVSLLRAVGMTAAEVRRSITAEGVFVAALGTAAGLLFGLAGAALLLLRLADDNLTLAPPWLVLASAATVIIAMVASAAWLIAGRATNAAPNLATAS